MKILPYKGVVFIKVITRMSSGITYIVIRRCTLNSPKTRGSFHQPLLHLEVSAIPSGPRTHRAGRGTLTDRTEGEITSISNIVNIKKVYFLLEEELSRILVFSSLSSKDFLGHSEGVSVDCCFLGGCSMLNRVPANEMFPP